MEVKTKVKITHDLPNIVNKSVEDMEALLRKIQANSLNKEDQDVVMGCVEFAAWLPHALREKNISIRQLQRMLFGAGNGNGKNKKKKKKNKADSAQAESKAESDPEEKTNTGAALEVSPADTNPTTEKSTQPPAEEMKNSTKGHGRLAHTAYTTAIDVQVQFTEQSVGDACPEVCGGRLYRIPPGVMISISGNALATVHRYHLEKLRCSLCGIIVTASLPQGISVEKYDYAFKAQLALQKYYVATPFHRQENYQRLLGLPLPDATQFELVEQVADSAYPVIRVLEKIAANGEIIQNDDTYAKILSVIQDNQANPDKVRTGMYTTCIIAQSGAHKIALYYTGTQHAGENCTDVLRHRQPELSPIIQMCDASSMNIPEAMETILCNCLSHGFRKFRDLLEFFPEPCSIVIKALSIIFKNDAHAKSEKLDKMARWHFHRQHSKPVMLALHRWLKSQLADKQVEPNSSLGKAIRYLLKHWKALRRFLVVPGAPIDNNVVERALKIAIRVRKAALFYKTEHGARVGSILTSLIVTADLANENPFEYLVALQNYKSLVFKDPDAWTPWRYRETLKGLLLKKAA